MKALLIYLIILPIIDNIKTKFEPLEGYDKNGNKCLLVKENQYTCPTYCGAIHAHRIYIPLDIDTSSVELLEIN
tara:strand:+ start:269 stop:490 length:222 start_codon:yes stop_codon:yes gene_type:complete